MIKNRIDIIYRTILKTFKYFEIVELHFFFYIPKISNILNSFKSGLFHTYFVQYHPYSEYVRWQIKTQEHCGYN